MPSTDPWQCGLQRQRLSRSDCGAVTVSANLPPPAWVCTTGNVSRLNYGNSEDMKGIIAPTGAVSVTLTFSAFNTELAFDKLTVFSCVTIDCAQTSVLLDEHYGSVVPSRLTSNTGIMLIMSHSDASPTRSCWSATWNVGGMSAVYCPCPLKTSSAIFHSSVQAMASGKP